jgi:hypothetical protein
MRIIGIDFIYLMLNVLKKKYETIVEILDDLNENPLYLKY